MMNPLTAHLLNMNRRELIKLFGGLAGASLVPTAAFAAINHHGSPDVVGWLVGCQGAGSAESSEVAHFGIMRGTNELLRFSINAYGGLMQWVCPPDSYIAVTRDKPLTMYSSSPRVKAYGFIQTADDDYQVIQT
jgi:hypothetical protein